MSDLESGNAAGASLTAEIKMAQRSNSRSAGTRPISPIKSSQTKGKSSVLKASIQSKPTHRSAQSYGGPPSASISDRIDKLLREIEETKRSDTDATPPLGLLTQSNRTTKPGPAEAKIPTHHRVSSSRSITQKTHSRKSSLTSIARSQSIVAKVAHRSEVGYIPGNTAKVNQDVYIECEELTPDSHLFSVCDGHGYYGHEVSGFLKQRLPNVLEQELRLFREPHQAIVSAITKCDSDLSAEPVDVRFSGSTLNLIFLRGSSLLCANVGDSRSLLARELRPGHWMCVALSRDHKPDTPDEYDRIIGSGGRVMAYQDESGQPAGPARVWVRNQNTPGLAMSRSIGDAVARSVGVSCEPEVFSFDLATEDKFLVLGSDGVFEFLTNEEVVKIVVPYWKKGDVQGACDSLFSAARSRWTKVPSTQEEDVIDDITCIIVFLAVNRL